MDASGCGKDPDSDAEQPDKWDSPDLEEWDSPDLEEWDPEDLPKVWNAESLDQAELAPSQILALRFRGEGIGDRGVDLRLFSALLEAVNRLLVGLQPVAAGLQVELGGPLPKLPGIEPPLLQGAGVGQSITIVLGLAGQEARLLRAEKTIIEVPNLEMPDASELPSKADFERLDDVRLAADFPTLRAADWVAQLLSSPPDRATEQIQRLGRRATRDYLNMTDVLAKNEVDTYARRPRGHQVELPSRLAFVQAREIRDTEHRVATPLRLRGALYQADAKNRRFRLITDEGESISGTYLPELIDEVRGAWAKIVSVEITRFEFHWAEADRPHRTTFQLEKVLRVIEDADARLREIEEHDHR